MSKIWYIRYIKYTHMLQDCSGATLPLPSPGTAVLPFQFCDFASWLMFSRPWVGSLAGFGQPDLSQSLWAHCILIPSWGEGFLGCCMDFIHAWSLWTPWLHFNGKKAVWQYQLLFCWGSNTNPQGFAENNLGRWFVLLKYLAFVPAELHPILKIFFFNSWS